MKRAAQILVIAVIVGLGFWLWSVMFPSPETVIRSRLNKLASALSFSSNGGLIGKAYDAQKAAEFFTPDVDVEVNLAGYEPISLHGRDEVLQIVMAARARLTSLKIEFPDMNISIAADGQSAKVNLTGKGVVPGERDISAQEFNFLMKKVDGKWLIYQVETVKTLSALTDNAAETIRCAWNCETANLTRDSSPSPPRSGREGWGEVVLSKLITPFSSSFSEPCALLSLTFSHTQGYLASCTPLRLRSSNKTTT